MDDQVSGARRNLSRPILRQYLAKCFALMRSHDLSLIEHRSTAGRERSPFELISRLSLFKEYAFRRCPQRTDTFFPQSTSNSFCQRMQSHLVCTFHSPVEQHSQSNLPNLHAWPVVPYSTVRTHQGENMSGKALFHFQSSCKISCSWTCFCCSY